jgi:hypothetical protein
MTWRCIARNWEAYIRLPRSYRVRPEEFPSCISYYWTTSPRELTAVRAWGHIPQSSKSSMHIRVAVLHCFSKFIRSMYVVTSSCGMLLGNSDICVMCYSEWSQFWLLLTACGNCVVCVISYSEWSQFWLLWTACGNCVVCAMSYSERSQFWLLWTACGKLRRLCNVIQPTESVLAAFDCLWETANWASSACDGTCGKDRKRKNRKPDNKIARHWSCFQLLLDETKTNNAVFQTWIPPRPLHVACQQPHEHWRV